MNEKKKKIMPKYNETFFLVRKYREKYGRPIFFPLLLPLSSSYIDHLELNK